MFAKQEQYSEKTEKNLRHWNLRKAIEKKLRRNKEKTETGWKTEKILKKRPYSPRKRKTSPLSPVFPKNIDLNDT